MAKRLEGKVAIVTGAASGIGKESAALFRKHGATVVGADLDPGADARCDAGSEAGVKELVEKVIGEHGQLDVFFANAGVSGGLATLSQQTEQDWADVLRINLIGCAMAIKYAAPAMTAGGSIICTASVAGLASGAGGAAYSASKAGVINLVKNACQQLGGSGIRVNAICPGLIETGMTAFMYDAARSRGQEQRIGELNPLRRGGQPLEIANAALFLASDEASYVNGHALVVDGGLSTSQPIARNHAFTMLKD